MNCRIIATFLGTFVVAMTICAISPPDSTDATDGAIYGSDLAPFGGIAADWDDLIDGGVYYVQQGEPIMVSFGGISASAVSYDSDSGLVYQAEDNMLCGFLASNCDISLDGKTVKLICTMTTIYGNLPIYGATVDHGTMDSPLEKFEDSQGFAILSSDPYFIKVGGKVDVNAALATSVTSGYGLELADGKLTGTISKAGTITVKSTVSFSTVPTEYVCTIIAVSDGTKATSVSISGSSNVDMGDMIALSATVMPSDATYKSVSWTLSDTSKKAAGYVDDDGNFVVIGLSAGTVTVTATTKDGSNLSKQVTITINQKTIKTQTIKLEEHTSSDSNDVTVDADADLIYFQGTKAGNNSYSSIVSLNAPSEFVRISTVDEIPIYVYKPVAGVYNLGIHLYTSGGGNITNDDVDFTVRVKYTITFDANGGTSNTGQSTWSQSELTTVNLPTAIHSSLKFTGWYDSKSGGNFIGLAGASYVPTKNITLYAHWNQPSLVISSEFQWSGADGVTLTYTPKVKDSLTGLEVADFKVKLDSDATGCLNEDGSGVYGYMKDLIPGTYRAAITVSKTGYESASQEIIITMPVATLEAIDDSVVVGQSWTTTLTLKPTNAYIDASKISVKFNDGTAGTSRCTYSVSNGKTFVITCKTEGLFEISLPLTAPGITSSTKTIKLDARAAEDHQDPPSISSIKTTKYSSDKSPNTYYFSAIGAANYDVMTWDFGDGTTASESEVIHQFRQGVYTITCTVKNVTTNEAAKASIKLETLEEEEVDATDMINLNTPYIKGFTSEYSSLELTCTTSGGTTLSCFTMSRDSTSDGFFYRVSGTCSDIGLVGETVTFSVKSGSTVVKAWTAVIYPQSGSDEEISDFKASWTTDGLKVTLTGITPNKSSMSLLVDWGDDSNPNKGSASGEFSHEYAEPGTYTLQMVWKWTTGAGVANNGTYTVPITVSVIKENGQIVYHANGGSGTMASQTGMSEYTIMECTFTNGDRTCNYWSTSPNAANGTLYKPGEKVSPDGTLDLYAVWSDGNGGSDDGSGWKEIVKYVVVAGTVALIALFVARRML